MDSSTAPQASLSPLRIGIAGAGLLGRLLAWRLSSLGHTVSVFDAAASALPIPRSVAEVGDVPTAAAFTAAGMLSPIAELDNAEPAVAALGWRSIDLWADITARIGGSAPLMQHRGSLLLAHRSDVGAAQRVLDRLRHAEQSPDWQKATPAGLGVKPLSMAELAEIEPAVQGASHAWLLQGEGQIDTVAAMAALLAASPSVKWHWSQPVTDVSTDGTLYFTDGSNQTFDRVIDARGVGAKPAIDVRGVRGEVIWLKCPGHGLTRPIRLLHPRHRVYVVPRSAEDVLVGASEIESEDRSPVSLKTAVELMAAAHSVLPALAEARIWRLDANLRPATPDNGPVVMHEGARLQINGLFRHGWLLAPALVEQALRHAQWGGVGLTDHKKGKDCYQNDSNLCPQAA